MSRAPKNECQAPSLTTALSPFGVIDFVDNQCMQSLGSSIVENPSAVSKVVVGGPPAYLDAHGIRYVPSSQLDSAAETLVPPQSSLQGNSLSSELCRTSPLKNDSSFPIESMKNRVDNKIKRFLARNAEGVSEYDDDVPRNYRSNHDRMSSRKYVDRDFDQEMRRGDGPRFTRRSVDDYDRMPRSYDSMDDNYSSPEIKSQLRSIERQIGALEEKVLLNGNSKLDRDASLKKMSTNDDELEKLRMECEEAAMEAKSRLKSSVGTSGSSKKLSSKFKTYDY